MELVKPIKTETREHQPGNISIEKIVSMGNLAIRQEQLGINDPVTHLFQYLERGEESLVGIKEDIETDIAERLPNTPFFSQVNFEFFEDDFVSVNDKVSMNAMTKTNLEIFKQEAATDPSLNAELVRAKAEAQEVAKLTEWFSDAPVGARMIFESLPIGAQKFAISRIYQKVDQVHLEGSFVSLFNANVEQFNKFRSEMGVDLPAGDTEQEILRNNYEINNPKVEYLGGFVDYYVGVYDRVLQTNDGSEHSFGLEKDKDVEIQNGILKVKQNPKILSVYMDTIKTIASSKGVVTPELKQINDRLGISHHLTEGHPISSDTVRSILGELITSIASVIDRADSKLLNNLEHSDIGDGASKDTVSYYGEQARSEEASYASGGCQEFTRAGDIGVGQSAGNSNEFGILWNIFGLGEKLDNFGKPKIGVCRISNCPSRGGKRYSPEKTLVGGCDICVHCQKILGEKKSPERIYEEKRREEERKLKRAKRDAEIRAEIENRFRSKSSPLKKAA